MYPKVKRLIEILMIIMASPVIILLSCIVAAAIKIEGGKIIFTQERYGYKGHKFKMFKFRSMYQSSPGPQQESNITKVGKFIRKTKLDELPQFWNVLKGEMSIIGPRPEPEFWVEIMRGVSNSYVYRYNVLPGITGLTQVRLGYWTTKIEASIVIKYDKFYVENISPLLDLKIIFDTIKLLLRR